MGNFYTPEYKHECSLIWYNSGKLGARKLIREIPKNDSGKVPNLMIR